MKSLIYMILIILLAYPAIALSQDWKIWKDQDQPDEYYSKEIRARVVDAETGKPIKGATVIAEWVLESPFGEGLAPGGGSAGTIKTLTDENGWFNIPARGPIKRHKYTMLMQKDPMLIIYRSGYNSVFLIDADRKYLLTNGVTVRKLQYNNKGKLERIIVKTCKFDDIDSDTLDDGIRQDHSYEIIPKGAIRESIWNGRIIMLKKAHKSINR